VDLRAWVGERDWEGERRLIEGMMKEGVFFDTRTVVECGGARIL
jgi:hypothetical protein